MLLIDRSELFGEGTTNYAFVPLKPAGQTVPRSETVGADVSDRFNFDFYVDDLPSGSFDSVPTKKNGRKRCAM